MDGISSTFPVIQVGTGPFRMLHERLELAEARPETASLPMAIITGATSRRLSFHLGGHCRSRVRRCSATHGRKTIPVRHLKASSNGRQTRLSPMTPGSRLGVSHLLRFNWTQGPQACYLMGMYQVISIQGT